MAELDISGNSIQLDCSVDSGICVEGVTKDLKKKLQEFKRILFILERDKEAMTLLRERLSRIAERKIVKKKKDGQTVCNVCFMPIDTDDSKTCIACCSCAKNVCRGEKCSEWVPKDGEWRCQLCAARRDSYGKASTWVQEQHAVKRASSAEFSYSMRARSEIYIPLCDPNESAFLCNFESVSEAPSPINPNQKQHIREYIEEVLANMIGGSLETATVEQISTNGNYQQVRNGNELQGVSNVRLRRLIESIIAETIRQPPFASAGLITTTTTADDIDGLEALPLNGNHCNGNGGQYFESKKYQDLLATAVLNKIVNTHGNGRHSESSPDLTSSSVLDNNHNALILNKTDESISSSSSVEPRSESSLTDPIRSINKDDDLSGNYGNFYDDVANDNIEADRESVLSDFISSHMVPLPQISAEPASDEEEDEEDFISVASSRDATWEDNWLFKKKRSNKTSSSVGMLVPAPKEDIRALIGDKPTDEISDLSEVGSDTDDSSLEMVSASLEPLNDRLVNKHLIGGKNTKIVLDEIADRTSMISTSSLPDNVPPYTETKNEFVVSNDGLNESQPLKISVNNCNKAISNEAINSNVTKSIPAKAEKLAKENDVADDESIVPPPNDFTDDEKMRNLLAKFNEEQNNKTDSGDDNSSSLSPRSSISCALSAGIDRAELDAYEGITDFSVEDEEGLASEVDTAMAESSSRRPSVIEILAAIALGPMLAVSASDDRNILSEVELSSLMELNELAMAQLNAKAAEDRRLGVIVEESFDSGHCDERTMEISEEDDLLSSPRMVMEAIRELVGKDAIKSSRSEESSMKIEEITDDSAETEEPTEEKYVDKLKNSTIISSEHEVVKEECNNIEQVETEGNNTTEELQPNDLEDATAKTEENKNPEQLEIEHTFEIVSIEAEIKKGIQEESQCKKEDREPCEMPKELDDQAAIVPKDQVHTSNANDNPISNDEDNGNAMTSLSDDLGFEKIITEDTSSISDESLHTIRSSPSECSDLEGDTTSFFNEVNNSSVPSDLTDDQKLQQSKECNKTTNEFILPPPTAFCDEKLKKINEDGGTIETIQATEAHINSEAIQAEAQMTSANSTNEQGIKTIEEKTHTDNQCTDIKNKTEDTQTEPKAKEDKETVQIPETAEESSSQEVLPQSEKSEEPPDKESLDENQSKAEVDYSSELISPTEEIGNVSIQSSEIEAKSEKQDDGSKDGECLKVSAGKTEEFESKNIIEEQTASTDLIEPVALKFLSEAQLSSGKCSEENSTSTLPFDELTSLESVNEQNSALDVKMGEKNAEVSTNTEANEEAEVNKLKPESLLNEDSEVILTDVATENQKEENPENTPEALENETEETSKETEYGESSAENSNEKNSIESSTPKNIEALQDDPVKADLECVLSENKSNEKQEEESKVEAVDMTMVDEDQCLESNNTIETVESANENVSDDKLVVADTETPACPADETVKKPEDEILGGSIGSEEPSTESPSASTTIDKLNKDSCGEDLAESPGEKSQLEELVPENITDKETEINTNEEQTKSIDATKTEEPDPKTVTVPEDDALLKPLSENLQAESALLEATDGCTQELDDKEVNLVSNTDDLKETTSIEPKIEASSINAVINEDSPPEKISEDISPETQIPAKGNAEETAQTQINASNEQLETEQETLDNIDVCEIKATTEADIANSDQVTPDIEEPALVSPEQSQPDQNEAVSSEIVSTISTKDGTEDQETVIEEITKEINFDEEKQIEKECEQIPIPDPSSDLPENEIKIPETLETPETADIASVEPIFPTENVDKQEEPHSDASKAETDLVLENQATDTVTEEVQPKHTEVETDGDPAQAPQEETKLAEETNQEQNSVNEDDIISANQTVTKCEADTLTAELSTEPINLDIDENKTLVKHTSEASETENSLAEPLDDVKTNEAESSLDQTDSNTAEKLMSEADKKECEEKLPEAQLRDTVVENLAGEKIDDPQEALQTSESTEEIKTELLSAEGVSTDINQEEAIQQDEQDSNKTTDEVVTNPSEEIESECSSAEGEQNSNKTADKVVTNPSQEVEENKTRDEQEHSTVEEVTDIQTNTENQTQVKECLSIQIEENTSVEVDLVAESSNTVNEDTLEAKIVNNVDSSSLVEHNPDTTNSEEPPEHTKKTNELSTEISIPEEPALIDASKEATSCTIDEEKLQKNEDDSKEDKHNELSETPNVEEEQTKVLETDANCELSTEPYLGQIEKPLDDLESANEIPTGTIISEETIKETTTIKTLEALDNETIEKTTETVQSEDLTNLPNESEEKTTLLEEKVHDKQTEEMDSKETESVLKEADTNKEDDCQEGKSDSPQEHCEQNTTEQNVEAAVLETQDLANVFAEEVVIEPGTTTTDVNENIELPVKEDIEPSSAEQVTDQNEHTKTNTEQIGVTEESSELEAASIVVTNPDSNQPISAPTKLDETMSSEIPIPKDDDAQEKSDDIIEKVKSNEEVAEPSKVEVVSMQDIVTEVLLVQPETSEEAIEPVIEVQSEVSAAEVTENTNESVKSIEEENSETLTSEQSETEKVSTTLESVSEERREEVQLHKTPETESQEHDTQTSKSEEPIPSNDVSEEKVVKEELRETKEPHKIVAEEELNSQGAATDSQEQGLCTMLPVQDVQEALTDGERVSEIEKIPEVTKDTEETLELVQKSDEIESNEIGVEETLEVAISPAELIEQDVQEDKITHVEKVPEIEKLIEETKTSEEVSEPAQKSEESLINETGAEKTFDGTISIPELTAQDMHKETLTDGEKVSETTQDSEEATETEQKSEETELNKTTTEEIIDGTISLTDLSKQDVHQEVEKLTESTQDSEDALASATEEVFEGPITEVPQDDSKEQPEAPKHDEELTLGAENMDRISEEDVSIDKTISFEEKAEESKPEEPISELTEELPSKQPYITETSLEKDTIEPKPDIENTKDAPIIKEEVQKEEKEAALETQKSILDESVSTLKTDDEKIKSITNENESNLETDDEKIEKIPVLELQLIEDTTVQGQATESESVTEIDQESVPASQKETTSGETIDLSLDGIQKEESSEADISISNHSESQPPEEIIEGVDAEKVLTDEIISTANEVVEEDVKNSIHEISEESITAAETKPLEEESSEKIPVLELQLIEDTTVQGQATESESFTKIDQESVPASQKETTSGETIDLSFDGTQKEESSEADISISNHSESQPPEEIIKGIDAEKAPTDETISTANEVVEEDVKNSIQEISGESITAAETKPLEEKIKETKLEECPSESTIDQLNLDEVQEKEVVEVKTSTGEATESPITDVISGVLPIPTEVLLEKEPISEEVEVVAEVVDTSASADIAEVLPPTDVSSLKESEESASSVPVEKSSDTVNNQLTEKLTEASSSPELVSNSKNTQENVEESSSCAESLPTADENVAVEDVSVAEPKSTEEPIKENGEPTKSEGPINDSININIQEVDTRLPDSATESVLPETDLAVEKELQSNDLKYEAIPANQTEDNLITEAAPAKEETEELSALETTTSEDIQISDQEIPKNDIEEESNTQEATTSIEGLEVEVDITEITVIDDTTQAEQNIASFDPPEKSNNSINETVVEDVVVSEKNSLTAETVTEKSIPPTSNETVLDPEEIPTQVTESDGISAEEVHEVINIDTPNILDNETAKEDKSAETVPAKESQEISSQSQIEQPSVVETNEETLPLEQNAMQEVLDIKQNLPDKIIESEVVQEEETSLEALSDSEVNILSKPEETIEASNAEVISSENAEESSISEEPILDTKDVKEEVSNTETGSETTEASKSEESIVVVVNESNSKEQSLNIEGTPNLASEAEMIQNEINNELLQAEDLTTDSKTIIDDKDNGDIKTSVAQAEDESDSEASYMSATEEDQSAETKSNVKTAASDKQTESVTSEEFASTSEIKSLASEDVAIKELSEVKRGELVKEVWVSLDAEKESSKVEEIMESKHPNEEDIPLEDISIVQEKLTNIIDALQPEESSIVADDSAVIEEKPLDQIKPTETEELADVLIVKEPEEKEDDKPQSQSAVNNDNCSSREAQVTEEIADEINKDSLEHTTSDTTKEDDEAQTHTEVISSTETVEPKKVDTSEEEMIIKNLSESLEKQTLNPDCAVTDASTVEDKTSDDIVKETTPFAILNATCKIITHPPLEKTESLIQSAQYIYEKISDPLQEKTRDLNAPTLAEELRMAADRNDTQEPSPNAGRVIPQSRACESSCFTTDQQLNEPIASNSVATEQPNAQDAAQGNHISQLAKQHLFAEQSTRKPKAKNSGSRFRNLTLQDRRFLAELEKRRKQRELIQNYLDSLDSIDIPSYLNEDLYLFESKCSIERSPYSLFIEPSEYCIVGATSSSSNANTHFVKSNILFSDRISSESNCTDDNSTTTVIDTFGSMESRSSSDSSGEEFSPDDSTDRGESSATATTDNNSIITTNNATNQLHIYSPPQPPPQPQPVLRPESACSKLHETRTTGGNEEHVDDDPLKHLVPGSIAEREYKKWYNAVDMPNNPYSVEALRRRLSGGPDRVFDLPNISPCIEDKPLQLCENPSTEADNKGQERDYARYSRDYYINDAKHASGVTKKSPTSPPEISSPTPTASSIELEENVESTAETPVKEMCHKLEKQCRIEADIYLATPAHVIEDIPAAFADKNTIQTVETITSLTTEAVSKLSSETSSIMTNVSLTPSEDSDTIRIYDLKKQETRLVKESTHTTTITVPKSPEKKVRPTELDITPTLAPPIATISSKSSTPTSFKFLQPKRKLMNPSQVLSIDLDTNPITPSTPEKPVIEAEVAHAMPSVKALAKAFLMTSTTSTSENKWRKARAKSPLQFFKLTTQAAAASTSKVSQKLLEPVVPDTTSQGSEDATIASDLSSLETDPPSRIDGDTEDENQERVVLSGCLRNNIAFFENLKNK